jgi:hypothetical protein
MRKAAFLPLLCLATVLPAQVTLTKKDGQIDITVDGKPFSTFFVGPDAPKPYLHPLRSASGKVVTRGYPMLDIAAEPHDHPHHRGLWFTHGDVNGVDFWANEPSQGPKKGRVVLNKVAEVKSGKQSGTIRAVFDWRTPDGKTLLTETRTMVIYSHPTQRIIDFDVELKAGSEKVVFGDTKEGAFAIRLAHPLNEPADRRHPGSGLMVDAEGRSGEKQVWGKRSPWVDYSGTLEGEKLGIAIFDHPANPKHPTYWHSRSYGLFAANIFGEHDFHNDKARNGSVTVEAGGSLRFRYRVLIHPGNTQEAGIADLYKVYAASH